MTSCIIPYKISLFKLSSRDKLIDLFYIIPYYGSLIPIYALPCLSVLRTEEVGNSVLPTYRPYEVGGKHGGCPPSFSREEVGASHLLRTGEVLHTEVGIYRPCFFTVCPAKQGASRPCLLPSRAYFRTSWRYVLPTYFLRAKHGGGKK